MILVKTLIDRENRVQCHENRFAPKYKEKITLAGRSPRSYGVPGMVGGVVVPGRPA